jgi:hypothetical protein
MGTLGWEKEVEGQPCVVEHVDKQDGAASTEPLDWQSGPGNGVETGVTEGEDAFGEEGSSGEANCDVKDAGTGVEVVSTDIASNGLLLLAGAAEFCMNL